MANPSHIYVLLICINLLCARGVQDLRFVGTSSLSDHHLATQDHFNQGGARNPRTMGLLLHKWWENGCYFLWWFTVIGSNGNFNGIWLVVSTYPSEKYFPSSVGTMKFPIYGKNNPNAPNHQPVTTRIWMKTLGVPNLNNPPVLDPKTFFGCHKNHAVEISFALLS